MFDHPEDRRLVSVKAFKAAAIPAFACALVSVLLMRTGFFLLFFLVPLGFCALAFGAKTAWLSFFFTLSGHAVLSAVSGIGTSGAVMNILYFAALALGFIWIMAGNPPGRSGMIIPEVRTAFRFIAAAVLGTVPFFIMVVSVGAENLAEAITLQGEMLLSGIVPASALEDAGIPQMVMRIMTMALRGGMLAWVFAWLFFSRQTALILARLFRRQRENGKGDLPGFHVPRNVIWIFSASILAALFFRAVSLEAMEIAAWNLFIICAVMYLAQGGGIVMFALARRSVPRVFRLLLFILLVITFFSPGINIFVVAALLLLGVAENWLPLRAVKPGNTGEAV